MDCVSNNTDRDGTSAVLRTGGKRLQSSSSPLPSSLAVSLPRTNKSSGPIAVCKQEGESVQSAWHIFSEDGCRQLHHRI